MGEHDAEFMDALGISQSEFVDAQIAEVIFLLHFCSFFTEYIFPVSLPLFTKLLSLLYALGFLHHL